MKSIPIYLCLLFVALQSYGQQTDSLIKHVYFDFDKYELTNESTATLQQIRNSERTIQGIFIEANTDFRGSVEYNKTLGKNRANTVKNYFIDKGINENIITIQNYGEAKPLFTNETEDGMAKNRRVDILILYESEGTIAEEPIEMVQNQGEGLYDFLIGNENDINELYAEIKDRPQEFTISGQDTFLVTKSGVLIEIPQGAFDNEGKPITISVIEGITIEQMIRNGFSTIDEIGRVLQTGGMVDVKASIDGQPVELEQPIRLHIPTQTPLRNPKHFVGKSQNANEIDTLNGKTVERNMLNWSLTEQTIQVNPVNLSTFEAMPCCEVKCLTGESKALVEYWKTYDKASYEIYQSAIEKGSEKIVERCEELKAKNKAILESFQRQNEMNSTTELTTTTFYVLDIPALRPANVDVYYSQRLSSLVKVSTTVPANSGVSFYYISKKENFIINAFGYNRVFHVPKNTPLTILGLAKDKDNQTRVALMDIAAEEKVYELEFFPVSDKELDVILSSLNQ